MIEEIFLLLGILLFIGYFSLQFFKKTHIPDVLLLMFVGILIGPILGFANGSPGSTIAALAPLIGTAALIIILFDGGINLNLSRVVNELLRASLFTVLTFALTVIFSGALMLLFGWPFIQGLLLGAVLGGTSSAIVISVVSQLSLRQDLKIILSLESALTDALCVIAAIAILQFMTSTTAEPAAVAGSLASAFSIAIVGGLVLALVWAQVMKQLKVEHFGYMLTMAFVFVVYAIINYLHGSGAIGVLVFGLALANLAPITKLARIKNDFVLDEKMRDFQKEISFFVRTFFFIYIGVIFSLSALTPTIIAISIAFIAIALIARALAVKTIFRSKDIENNSRRALTTMMPRGLAAAVLAGMPLAMGINIPAFAEIVFVVIILSNIVTTIGVYLFERQSQPTSQKKPKIVSVVPAQKTN